MSCCVRADINIMYDIVVVGAGINGLCTAYHLSKSSLNICLIEQFQPGHMEGSSHSKIRITRSTYSDPIYMMMAEDSRKNYWPVLEKEFNCRLVYDSPFMTFGNDELYQGYKKTAIEMNLPTMKIVGGKKAEKMNPSMRLSDF